MNNSSKKCVVNGQWSSHRPDDPTNQTKSRPTTRKSGTNILHSLTRLSSPQLTPSSTRTVQSTSSSYDRNTSIKNKSIFLCNHNFIRVVEKAQRRHQKNEKRKASIRVKAYLCLQQVLLTSCGARNNGKIDLDDG